jgi:hypothetical protein
VYCFVVKSYCSSLHFAVIDSFLQELHPFIYGEFKNFSVFHTFYSHLCSYTCSIETWYIVYCFVLKSYSSCFDVIEYFLQELNPLILEKSLNLTVFWIYFLLLTSLQLLHWNLVYRFVVKSDSSSSLFSGIDLLFFTKVDRRILPRLVLSALLLLSMHCKVVTKIIVCILMNEWYTHKCDECFKNKLTFSNICCSYHSVC